MFLHSFDIIILLSSKFSLIYLRIQYPQGGISVWRLYTCLRFEW